MIVTTLNLLLLWRLLLLCGHDLDAISFNLFDVLVEKKLLAPRLLLLLIVNRAWIHTNIDTATIFGLRCKVLIIYYLILLISWCG